MSVSSVSSSNGGFYNTIIQPIKNVAVEVGDEIESAYDSTADAVSSAAHAVADSVSSGIKAIGNIIDTTA
ncbi:protamine P1 domain containing protein [Herbaspirillum sp. AP02]|uniref:protamine P1 domain containing protein n=1 Tax=unclassified Herbaspirillum TaxID=2624150 RepID=UPI0015DB7055|nr:MULTISPECIES: protamine P1 domain containing protein [unclassified Herbaspirillum]MBG7619031.1 protamine P1 domain containing protein [Herbaspirillum sp. AP02]NZD66315.1 protamine P1 domain containing protein [Herbaspirillum sp. AP21]